MSELTRENMGHVLDTALRDVRAELQRIETAVGTVDHKIDDVRRDQSDRGAQLEIVRRLEQLEGAVANLEQRIRELTERLQEEAEYKRA